LIIYCESESQPEDWNSSWNVNGIHAYWAGEWHYENGKPVHGAGQNS
jgi:hypothetical protein